MEPNPNDLVTFEDKVIYLYLLSKMPKKRWTNMRANKMLFLVKYHAFINNQLIVHMNFKRNTKGPTSKHTWDIKREFAPNKIIDEYTEPGYDFPFQFAQINSVSEYILEDFSELFEINIWIKNLLDDFAQKYGNMDTQEIRNNHIYPKYIHGRTIGEIPVGEYLDMRVPVGSPVFNLDDNWKESLKLEFNPGFHNQMNEMCNEIKLSSWSPFEPLQ